MYYVGKYFPYIHISRPRLFPIRKVLDKNRSGGVSAKKRIKGATKTPSPSNIAGCVTCHGDSEDEKCAVISCGSKKSSDEGRTRTNENVLEGTTKEKEDGNAGKYACVDKNRIQSVLRAMVKMRRDIRR